MGTQTSKSEDNLLKSKHGLDPSTMSSYNGMKSETSSSTSIKKAKRKNSFTSISEMTTKNQINTINNTNTNGNIENNETNNSNRKPLDTNNSNKSCSKINNSILKHFPIIQNINKVNI